MMKNKRKYKKLYTQQSLKWSLKIGDYLGTLTPHQAVKLVNTKPAIFHRWMSGKLAAPVNKLEKIKSCAFAEFRRRHRKALRLQRITASDVEVIKAKFLWKNMIFDQMNMITKRRFCIGLKKLYR
jgi:hypothetical protein